jgi:hypothetical protein
VLENGAVDGEDNDVGCRHLERHAKDPVECHVERADEPVSVVASMRDRPETDQIEQWAEVRVQDEQGRGYRQHPSSRASGRLENEQNRHDAEAKIDRAGRRGPVREGGMVDEWPAERDDRESREGEVESRVARGSGECLSTLLRQSSSEEHDHQREEQEARPIDLRFDDRDDPIQPVK